MSGMTQREIRTKFDEIVAFAEVGQFLDTPVKRYSSGMYVRLAFSVAAGGICPCLRRVAGCATPTGSAGHASATASPRDNR